MSFTHRGFTLVELMVGILIFSLGLTSIYTILNSTFRNASYSRHEVVVAGLLREQIELVKNIRDTNVRAFAPWDSVLVEKVASTTFGSGVYIIENDFSSPIPEYDIIGSIKKSPVYLKDITLPFSSATTLADRFALTRLSLDTFGRYTHASTGSGTAYASYSFIRPLSAGGVLVQKDGKNQGYVIDARVIVSTGNGYREYDARSLITDWLR